MPKFQMTPEGKARFKHLVTFGRNLLESGDIDPIYPVLVELQKTMSLDTALWHTLLYVAWYNLPSGVAAFEVLPHPDHALSRLDQIPDNWPTGIERRSNRGGVVRHHLEEFSTQLADTTPSKWFRKGLVRDTGLDSRIENWHTVNERIQSVWGNGRWAAYKHCEILRRVHNLPVEAPDMGNKNSSGPREGLATIFGAIEGQGAAVIELLDQQGLYLQGYLRDAGLEVDIEELETILCNWKSLLKGHYYVGNDIDEFQEQIDVALERGYISSEVSDCLYAARLSSLPHDYLGELHGWHGLQKDRRVAYRDREVILVRREGGRSVRVASKKR